ncbi:MAG: lytic transglycosylase domain-containing protein [Sphingosinicella sp.]
MSRWHSLRQNDSFPFESYAQFLNSHRGWPGENAIRRVAERRIQPDSSPAEIVRFFQAYPPLTASGQARHAFALLALGRPQEARAAARAAWNAGVMPLEDEQRLLGQFGDELDSDVHDRRLEQLLADGDTASAQRSIGWALPARRPFFEARLALQTRAPDATQRLFALGGAGSGDPGLLIDRVRWLRSSGDPLAARLLLAQPRRLTAPARNPARFMETLVTIARAAANDRQWTLTYDIARQVDGIYPEGTDISRKTFAERDQYTNLTWLAGMTALERLGRPAAAVTMFELYARGSQSPQSRTKGLYWAARAARRAGLAEQARVYLEEAAEHYDQYYGQLAAEQIGRGLSAPSNVMVVAPSTIERRAFEDRPIVAAMIYLGRIGSWRDQSEFVRTLAEQVTSDQERLLAVELGRAIGRPDLGVLVARRARSNGDFDYAQWGFPQVAVPAAQQHQWTIVHAIARQETLFDRQAVSPAGARGLMQLMPGTARETARRIGISYDFGRLTSDVNYNVLLGSTYFGRLLEEWGGNYPLAVASYNAGSGNVLRWIRENGDPRAGVPMVDWIEAIPFFETRNYVQRVLENAVVYDLINPNRAASPRGGRRLSYYLGNPVPAI